MASRFHIRLMHMELSETQARIISLLIYGLEYWEIKAFLGLSKKTIINNMSKVTTTLELSGIYHLIRLARTRGFGFNGCYYQTELFSPDEHAILLRKFPRMKEETALTEWFPGAAETGQLSFFSA